MFMFKLYSRYDLNLIGITWIYIYFCPLYNSKKKNENEITFIK